MWKRSDVDEWSWRATTGNRTNGNRKWQDEDMHDFWRKYHEEGAAAIPEDAAALVPLTWVEVEELHPKRVPVEYAGADPLSSPFLIQTSPFVLKEAKGRFWSFKAEDPAAKRVFEAEIDYSELLPAIGATDYFGAEDAGILTCGCGIPGCAGIWSQTCHVSRHMVHWTVRETGHWTDLFFEREAYERGMVGMLHEMVTSAKAKTASTSALDREATNSASASFWVFSPREPEYLGPQETNRAIAAKRK